MTRGVLITILLLFSCFAINGQNVHTVKRGETLESIASFYHVTIDDLKRSNDNTEMLFPGLLLTIPQNKNVPQPIQIEKEEAPQLDKVEMKDGSYIVCQVVSVRKTTILIKQEDIEGNISIPIKDVIEVFYANGNKKKFGKR